MKKEHQVVARNSYDSSWRGNFSYHNDLQKAREAAFEAAFQSVYTMGATPEQAREAAEDAKAHYKEDPTDDGYEP